VRPKGLGKLEKIHLIGTRSRYLPASSIVPQPLCYRVPIKYLKDELIEMCLKEVHCEVHIRKISRLFKVQSMI
jgi:hypothetical protein